MKHRARDVLAVLTSETMRDFVLVGGTSTWKLSPKSAKDCRYVVCVKNDIQSGGQHRGQNHGMGFLIGWISSIRPSKLGYSAWKDSFERKSSQRFTVHFSEYADINVPEFWGNWQNPIKYLKGDEVLSMLGIESFDELAFESLAISSHSHEQEYTLESPGRGKAEAQYTEQGLTIDQAKAGIAVRMGIPPQNIEIRINT